MSKSVRIVLTIITVWLVFCACIIVFLYSHYRATRPQDLPLQAYEHLFRQIGSEVIAKDGNKAYREHQVVVITFWAGLTKPSGSGGPSISMDKGRIGVVTKALSRDILEVMWLDQEWSQFPAYWKKGSVPAFTCSINTDWIAPLEAKGSQPTNPPYSSPAADSKR